MCCKCLNMNFLMKEEGFKCYTAFYCEPVLRSQRCDLLDCFLLDDVQQRKSFSLTMKNTVVQPGRSQIGNLVACLSQAGHACFSQCNTEGRGTCYGHVLLGSERQILVRENSWIPSSGASSLHQVILKGLESQHNKNVVAVYSRV